MEEKKSNDGMKSVDVVFAVVLFFLFGFFWGTAFYGGCVEKVCLTDKENKVVKYDDKIYKMIPVKYKGLEDPDTSEEKQR